MPSTTRNKNDVVNDIFFAMADAILRCLNDPDLCNPQWVAQALVFCKQNGEVSQLPVPGSKISEIHKSLPFQKLVAVNN